ncbi:CHAD domain-containing protein [Paraburkholderia azotifigens]|uniref:CHAD domain-containing protein n=1 Tax=Paraburkholderia azotifigens TaxID=2057004 RepID=A0ABU9R2Z2_9BURK
MSSIEFCEYSLPVERFDVAFAALAKPLVQKALTHAGQIAGDPENLHQLRVTLRTKRSLWWAYRPLLDKEENTRQRTLFKALADAAGKTRDYDILIELLGWRSQLDGQLSEQLASARQRALEASNEALGRANLEMVLQDALTRTSRECATTAIRQSLLAFAEGRVLAPEGILEKRIRRATEVGGSRCGALHDVRKACKRARYLLDLFAPILGRPPRKRVERLKEAQTCVGNLNDLVSSEALLREDIEFLSAMHRPE